MNTYRQALDALRFTPEQKAAIAETLLSAAQAGQSRTPRRKWGRVIAAAAVAAALCAACASGALQEALSVLASQFGSDPKQQEVIGDLTRPSAASATDNGVTISVDAVMGDGNSHGGPLPHGAGRRPARAAPDRGDQERLRREQHPGV